MIFEQADKFAYMAMAFKEKGLSVWSYTGYTYEYILENKDIRLGWNELLNDIRSSCRWRDSRGKNTRWT